MAEILRHGKLPPKIDSRTIRLSSIIKRELLPPLPDHYDVDEGVGGIDNKRMFGNDKYGCCVIAAQAHQTFRFEKFEQGEQIEITDQEVIDEYFRQTGGADRGLILLLSLNQWRNVGWPVGGKTYMAYAHAAVDWKNHEEVCHCIHLLGGVDFGMKVYRKDMEQFNADEPWHLTGHDGEFIGGHGVYLHNYERDDMGITCTTWGRKQPMTWDFWDARVDEAYGIVDNRNSWMGEDSPVDMEKLDGYLKEISGNGRQSPGCSFWPVTIMKELLRR